jgi:hypothetical protein
LAKAILEPDADYEPEFVKEQYARRDRNEKRNEHEAKEGYSFYDITAWSLPHTFGLEAYWTEDSLPFQGEQVKLNDKGTVSFKSFPTAPATERSPIGYVFKYDSDAAGILAARLLADGFRLAVANKPFKADGASWPVGSFIIRVSRNPANLYDHLKSMAQELGVTVKALKSAYSDDSNVGIHSESIRDLVSPRIAVLAGDPTDQSSYGALWYMLQNQIKLPFSALKADSLASVDLSRFTAIVVPDGYGYTDSIGKGGIAKLKEWINRGGALIGFGNGGQWMIDKDAGISTARKVGEDDKSADAKPDAPKSDDKPEADEKKPKKPVNLPGGIFRATLDPTHYLAYGYEGVDLAVPVAGDVFLKPSKDGSNPVKFGAGPLRLSGFTWPKNTEDLLANTSWAIDEPMGRGHAIIFLHDPVFRAYWTGLRKMLLNAMILSPSRSAVE